MFELALPTALLLLPLPLLIWFLIPRATQIVPVALTVPFYDALVTLIKQKKHETSSKKSIYLLGLIWILIVVAVAGPRWVGAPIPLEREGRNIMLVLDLSASMDLDDMVLNGHSATRLSVVKLAAKQFVLRRAGDRIGLILFGSRAYLQTPLTYDHQNVLMRMEDATVGLAGTTTSIGDALGLAVKRLQDVPPTGRVIILLTDGANNSGVLSPLKAAQLAKMDKMKVYTIGLGSNANPRGMSSLFMGLNPTAELDEAILKQIAQTTNGRYFYANDPQTLQQIYQTINRMEAVQQEESTVRPQEEYYPWLLAGALLIWFIWFLMRAV
ncbi:MAG: hypothetical protein A3F46_03475 [Legionellales bacterium RIFCSPHIGHO2_12_FULL_42_9]|nr:MAG: hypothetical protein A3F46_03475 [Legionellales bacterium RIFCSPHIGHO2_12_FULL_42_9]